MSKREKETRPTVNFRGSNRRVLTEQDSTTRNGRYGDVQPDQSHCRCTSARTVATNRRLKLRFLLYRRKTSNFKPGSALRQEVHAQRQLGARNSPDPDFLMIQNS